MIESSLNPSSSISMPTSQLNKTLKRWHQKNSPTHILETGTYLGLGSTITVANSIEQPIEKFVTIEANWSFWRSAKINLQKFKFIEPIWGLSVKLEDAINFIQSDDAISDHQTVKNILIDNIDNPTSFYLNEIRGKLGPRVAYKNLPRYLLDKLFRYSSDNLLFENLTQFRNKKPLVVLDSCGGVGLLEFQIVEELMLEHYHTLLLDDINHLKHFRSFKRIKSDSRYRIIDICSQGRWIFVEYLP